MRELFTILAAVSLFDRGPRLILTYVVQFFILYKMVKKHLVKQFPFVSKQPSQYSKNTDFQVRIKDFERFPMI